MFDRDGACSIEIDPTDDTIDSGLWSAHASPSCQPPPPLRLTRAARAPQTTQASKCVGFVRFADWPSAEKALHLMDGQVQCLVSAPH
jgi:hypothetical protein